MTAQDYATLIEALSPLIVVMVLPAIRWIVRNILREYLGQLSRIEKRQELIYKRQSRMEQKIGKIDRAISKDR